MLGNDVVDLRDPETRPGAPHPRFDERVFGPEERRAIARSADPQRTRWTLWAAKESAYKRARKRDPRARFAPRAFAVDLGAGRVRGGGGEHRLILEPPSAEDADLVHVVAVGADGSAADPICEVAVLAPGEDPGAAARALAAARLAAQLGADPEELRVRRGADRVPRLHHRGRALAVDLSLSHHGRLVAFAALIGTGTT